LLGQFSVSDNTHRLQLDLKKQQEARGQVSNRGK
ncbi:hypothetical protein PSYPI_49532, partial [Pseudomonas syringae pv. pisi str. 1704B]